jgi:hypothetical protein
LRQKRTRTRRHSLQALAVLLLAGGCGGGGGEAAPPPPSIEPATAERLAATSESIAELLDQDDICTAAGRADELLAQVTEAINAGAVPRRFQEELSAKANELVNEVNCPPPPPAETDEEDDDEGNGRGQGKKQDEDEGKKEEAEPEPPIEIPTVPEDE